MGRPEITVEDYEDAYGPVDEDAFGAALRCAEAEVASIVGYAPVDTPAREGAWRRAVMAAVSVDAAYGFSHGIGESAESVTLGKFSYSASSPAPGSSPWRDEVRAAARRELVGSGLLYQGLAL